MAQILNSQNVMLKGPGGLPYVETDSNLSGNGLHETPLGINDPVKLSGYSGGHSFTKSISNSADVISTETDSTYSMSYDYHYMNSAGIYGNEMEQWYHYTEDPEQSGTYRKAYYGYNNLSFTSGIYDSGYHSAGTDQAQLSPNGLSILSDVRTAAFYTWGINTKYQNNTDRITANSELSHGQLDIYSADYWGSNTRTTIKGGPVNNEGTTIEWSPSASGTFRNSGAGIFLRNWSPATINYNIQGVFLDCNGFEYHDHSLNKYYSGGDIWASAAWYRNQWSVMSTGNNHMGLINARPANGHNEYGEQYWLTMQYQGWTTSGFNSKVAMYSERSAQYSYSGTRYVQDNGISANYTPTGITFTSGGETLELSFEKIKSLLALV